MGEVDTTPFTFESPTVMLENELASLLRPSNLKSEVDSTPMALPEVKGCISTVPAPNTSDPKEIFLSA